MRKDSRKVAKELAALARMPDEKFALTDAPEVRQWRGAVVGKFYRPIKRPVTIRVYPDVLAWLKRQGRGSRRGSTSSCLKRWKGNGGGRRGRKIAEEKSKSAPLLSQRTLAGAATPRWQTLT